ncbi:unnamed protein product [Lampetra fluviatilis]
MVPNDARTHRSQLYVQHNREPPKQQEWQQWQQHHEFPMFLHKRCVPVLPALPRPPHGKRGTRAWHSLKARGVGNVRTKGARQPESHWDVSDIRARSRSPGGSLFNISALQNATRDERTEESAETPRRCGCARRGTRDGGLPGCVQ